MRSRNKLKEFLNKRRIRKNMLKKIKSLDEIAMEIKNSRDMYLKFEKINKIKDMDYYKGRCEGLEWLFRVK